MLAPGQLIGDRLRVERVIGAGGMGVVAAARHIELQQDVAVKMLLPQLANDAHIVERFLREARAVASLRTEHVCRVFDVARTADGAPYIVMELLQGSDIASMIAKRPLPPSIAVEYALQACVALAEAHPQGIVHRDLKPANLFVVRRPDGGPLVKVLDFGIAKAADELRLTGSMAMLGSPPYMSPEQLMSPRDVDARTDIWSLGVTLYQMLSGMLPFRANSVGEMAVAITSEHPQPIDVDPGLRAVVFRCLEKDLSRRWPDVAMLAAALAPFGGPSASAFAALVRARGRASDVVSAQAAFAAPTAAHGPAPFAQTNATAAGTTNATYATHGGPNTAPNTSPNAAAAVGTTAVTSRRIPVWVPICVAILAGAVIVGVIARGGEKSTTVAAATGSGSGPAPPVTPPPATPTQVTAPATGSAAIDPWAPPPSSAAPTATEKTVPKNIEVVAPDDPDDDVFDTDAQNSYGAFPGATLTAEQRKQIAKSLDEVDKSLPQYKQYPQVAQSILYSAAAAACMIHDGARAKRYLSLITDPAQRKAVAAACAVYAEQIK